MINQLRKKINSILPQLQKINVAVIGDLIYDRYIWGEANRLSPEAPVPVILAKKESEHLGGAGNVIANLAGLNVNPTIVGALGSDLPGKKIINLFKNFGIKTQNILIKNGGKTTQKTRIVANNQQLIRFDWDNKILDENDKKLLINNIKRVVNEVDIVIVSDYNKGVCTDELVQTSIDLCKKKKIPIIIDPKEKNFNKYAGATLVKPNLKETQDIVPFELNDNESFKKATNWIMDNYEIDKCLITRGKNGMVFNDKKKTLYIPSLEKNIYDVSGAGDTVIATLAVFLCCGFNYEESVNIANEAASIVVTYPGTHPININTLINGMNQ